MAGFVSGWLVWIYVHEFLHSTSEDPPKHIQPSKKMDLLSQDKNDPRYGLKWFQSPVPLILQRLPFSSIYFHDRVGLSDILPVITSIVPKKGSSKLNLPSPIWWVSVKTLALGSASPSGTLLSAPLALTRKDRRVSGPIKNFIFLQILPGRRNSPSFMGEP